MTEQNKQAAGAAYVITLYNDMENLLWYHATYANLLVKLKANYGKKDLEDDKVEMEESDRFEIEGSAQNVRAMVIRTSVKVKALAEIVPEFEKKMDELDALRLEVVDKPVPSLKAVEDYVVTLNSMFVAGVVGELLSKAFEAAVG